MIGMLESMSREFNLNKCLLIIVLVSVASSLNATARFTEKQLVSYAMGLDVAKLDPALPSERLDEWLRSGPPHVEKATWEMSDCDLKGTGDPKYVAPLCVKVRFIRGSVGGWVMVRVGTFLNGISGEPHFENLLVATRGKLNFHDSEKLSGLPRLLDDVSASTGSK
jgi:hypothetical protein